MLKVPKRLPKEAAAEKPAGSGRSGGSGGRVFGGSGGAAGVDADPDLLAALRALRTSIAQEEGVPAYIVFSNATLADMAAKQPGDLDEFLDVSGVGRVKAEKYGERFLAAIRAWKAGE